jgi:hypothetical protein
MRNFAEENVYRKSKYRFYVQKLFLKNYAIYEIMWKNMVQSDRPQITVQYGACALHAG